MKRLFVILFVAFFTSLSGAQAVLDDLSLLYKMAQTIRGTAPSVLDKNELAQAQSKGNVPEFFNAKAAEYLRDPQHAVKMTYRLSELFRVRVPLKASDPERPDPPLPKDGAPAPPRDFSETSLGELFYRVAKENLSIDELATGRKYKVFSRGASQGPGAIGDFGFFQRLAGLASNAHTGNLANDSVPNESRFVSQNVQLGAEEPQVAGAITTTRFFERYANSQTNHNRRRAAAIYRIFLCDNMSPMVPRSDTDDPEIVSLLYPDHGSVSENKIANNSLESLHGSQNLCIGCHQKLDPVGHVFDTSAVVLARTPAEGALVMVRPGSAKDVIPVRGFAQLGSALVQQPEYNSCQVRRFWNWFVGQNVPLSENRMEQLAQRFQELGHRTNDFIQYLVNQPEFRLRIHPSPEIRVANRVAQLFSRCAECHQASSLYYGPDLSEWPLHSPRSGKTAKQWLDKVSDKIALQDNGKNAKMPPAKANWKLSEQDYSLIKTWLAMGAPDQFGKKQVSQ